MNTIGQWCCLWLLAVVVCGCESRNEYAEPPPPKVTVALPVKRDVQVYFETTGQTRAAQQVDLLARVGGYLKEINFKDGELVKAGDTLFVIDQDTYIAAEASAKAALKRAEAQLRLAEQQLVRTSQLAREDAATESALDIQTANRDSRAADVDAEKAALREAELNLSYTVIRAPFDGRMGRHLVDIGNLVIAGQTHLASLESVDPMHAYFSLSESDLLHFMEMQRAGKLKPISEADPLTLDLALGDTQDFRFHGRLDFRKFGIDRTTGTAERRAVFPNSHQELLPGLFVRIRAAVGEPRPYLLVDEQAIGRDQRGDYVLVVGEDNLVEYRSVKLGPLDDGLQAIEKGIEETDRIVIRGLQRARPGNPVEPEEASMESSLPSPSTSPAPTSSGKAANGQAGESEPASQQVEQMRATEKGPENEQEKPRSARKPPVRPAGANAAPNVPPASDSGDQN